MKRHLAAVLLIAACSSPASADLVRINFTGIIQNSSHPFPDTTHGFIVYDSDAAETSTARFDGAIKEFELDGLKSSADSTILVLDGIMNFSSANGLAVSFGGSSSVRAGELSDVFPEDWTSKTFKAPATTLGHGHIDGPFSNGYLSSYSASSDADPEHTAVFHVANDGSDSDTCGNQDRKCRSINQAIRNAHDGDSIVVGVGVYGNLDRDGNTREDPSEEFGGSCFCLVLIDKRITILSERGPAATIIDARNTPYVAVYISAPGAHFGYAGMGFTVLAGSSKGPDNYGIRVVDEAAATIWGNRIVNGETVQAAVIGIWAHRSDLYDNEVTGFLHGVGIIVDEGRVVGNIVSENGTGIGIRRAVVEDNIIVDNRGDGLVISGPPGQPDIGSVTRVTRNDIVRNGGSGIRLAGPPSPADPSEIVIQDNNIFGNDRDATTTPPGMKCGVENNTGGFLWAANNYWGWLGGDADQACDSPGSTTVRDPVLDEPVWH
jgi:hypothetical protein